MQLKIDPKMLELRTNLMAVIGGASAASEATLSSCPLRFAIYVSIVRAINPEAVARW